MIHRTNSKLYKKAALHDIPQNTPFIFWDTCALLDILRIPYRQENVTAALTTYQQLYELIENDRIISLTSDMVLYEFNSHFDEISNELSKEVRRLKESIRKYVALMSDKKKEKISRIIPFFDIASLQSLDSLVRKIWKKTYIIREQCIYRNMAHTRTVSRIPPAKNKGEYKDCFIWSTFLKYARDSSSPCKIFFTTNIADYCNKEAKKIDDFLTQECSRIDNAYVYVTSGEVYGKLHRDFGM